MRLEFPAQVVATDVFRLTGRAEVPIAFYCSSWNGAHITLTVNNGAGAHDFSPATDPTDPLTGVSFEITGNLHTALVLGEGKYGFTVDTATPSAPIEVVMTHKQLQPGKNASSYVAIS
jgi:hypothetical protein